MFYYYGGKRRLAPAYPGPRYPTIIEPFAGAAGYSMHHLLAGHVDRVILVELDPRVAATWRRILASTPAELANTPIPPVGERTDDFLVMTAAASNGVARSHGMKVGARQRVEARRMLHRMARQLAAVVGRVEIIEGDYRDAPRLDEATYHVDPPYQPVRVREVSTANPKGMGYRAGCDSASLDYAEMGEWCRALPGQVIVCEQEGADWLPFHLLRAHGDSLGRSSSEVVWTSDPGHEQLGLDVDILPPIV